MKTVILVPFMIIYALALGMCLIMDLILKPFIFAATFFYSLTKELLK